MTLRPGEAHPNLAEQIHITKTTRTGIYKSRHLLVTDSMALYLLGPFGTIRERLRMIEDVNTSHSEGRRDDMRASRAPGSASGFTLAEVVISLAIAAMLFAGLISAYIQSSYRAEWTGYSLAAQSLAVQQLEQARSAAWDINTSPARNEITNVPTLTSAILDLPVTGTNVTWATNYSTILSVSITNTAGASVYMVRVDTVWPFIWRGLTRYYTNTVADMFAPD